MGAGGCSFSRRDAARTPTGEWVAASYRPDCGEWQSGRSSTGSLEELVALGDGTYHTAFECLHA